jgi:hypothetical protein
MADYASTRDVWVDEEAGPVVRPYTMTSGRTRSTGEFALITLIIATRPVFAVTEPLGPEHTFIIALCQRPQSVAEVSAHLNLPLGIVRVLLGDLLDRGLILARGPSLNSPEQPNLRVLEKVLNGLRSL